MFPNPAESVATIQSDDLIQSLSIVDERGRKVAEYGNVNRTSIDLNTSDIPSGCYFLQIQVADRIFNERLIILH